jgi:nicotinate-nucleotide pyrophosphorylase (carboxylating)
MLSAEMRKKLLGFLLDDIGKGDVTSTVLPSAECSAKIVAKEACIVAGIEEAKFLFNHMGVKAKALAKDGSTVRKGAAVLCLQGINRKILSTERIALNVLGRMSEVATTCSAAKRIAGKSVTIALTRKTMPGVNLFDKKAAALAGVWSHRINLNSFVLLKDNHLPFFNSPFDAVIAARKKYGKKMRIEIEVENLKQALLAAKAKPNIIMLDNLPAKKAVAVVKKLRAVFNGKIELSGGINLENLRRFVKAGPDIISMGCLTYSTRWRDFSLQIKK